MEEFVLCYYTETTYVIQYNIYKKIDIRRKQILLIIKEIEREIENMRRSINLRIHARIITNFLT